MRKIKKQKTRKKTAGFCVSRSYCSARLRLLRRVWFLKLAVKRQNSGAFFRLRRKGKTKIKPFFLCHFGCFAYFFFKNRFFWKKFSTIWFLRLIRSRSAFCAVFFALFLFPLVFFAPFAHRILGWFGGAFFGRFWFGFFGVFFVLFFGFLELVFLSFRAIFGLFFDFFEINCVLGWFWAVFAVFNLFSVVLGFDLFVFFLIFLACSATFSTCFWFFRYFFPLCGKFCPLLLPLKAGIKILI